MIRLQLLMHDPSSFCSKNIILICFACKVLYKEANNILIALRILSPSIEGKLQALMNEVEFLEIGLPLKCRQQELITFVPTFEGGGTVVDLDR